MRALLCHAVLLACSTSLAQDHVIGTPSLEICGGQLFDSGGATGNYSNNESLTTVLCPDAPGMQVSLTFTTFQLSVNTQVQGPADYLIIQDGPDRSSPVLGTYYVSSLAGVTVQPSGANSSGCLRLRFVSNETGVGNFAATIACEPRCTPPTASFEGMGDTLFVCPGATLALDASGSTVPGGVDAWTWSVNGTATAGSGSWPVDTLHFAEGGLHRVQLRVSDAAGCTSEPTEPLLVVVSNAANFAGTMGPQASCVGDTIAFNAVAALPPLVVENQPGGDYGTGVLLPDDVGPAFQFHTTIDHYPAGSVVSAPADLGDICITMEHTHVADLTMELICPNGQALTLHQMGTGTTMVGDPLPFIVGGVEAPGDCWTYCFNSTPEFGTWIEHRASGPDPNVMEATFGLSLIPGSYEPFEALSALVGCPVNGTWTLQVIDYWAADNGYLCEWSLGFDAFVDDTWQQVAPQLGMAHPDSAAWSGPELWPGVTPAEAFALQGAMPAQPYTFTVEDSYGCVHDTTTLVDPLPQPVVDAGADLQLCTGLQSLNGEVTWPGGDSCQFQLHLLAEGGGGWTGASVQVHVDGVLLGTYTVSFPGWSNVVDLTVANGAVLQLTYTPANATWNPFNSFVLYGPDQQPVYTSQEGPPQGVLFNAPLACTGPGLPLSVQWTPAAGLATPDMAITAVLPTVDTWYMFSATNQGQCTDRDSVFVEVDYGTTPLGYDAGDDILCAAPLDASGYTWLLNGQVMQSTTEPCLNAPAFGAWRVLVQNADGCDLLSEEVLHCPELEITQVAATLYTLPGAGHYIWTLNGDTLSEGPDAFILVQGFGTYGVQLITGTGCSVGAELEVGSTGIGAAAFEPSASVVPNPNTGSFDVRLPEPDGLVHIRVLDASGRVVLRTTGAFANGRTSTLQAPLAAGAYVVEVLLGQERWMVPMMVEESVQR